ncbi:C40 family peptidase [Gordonia sp. NPDC003429]
MIPIDILIEPLRLLLTALGTGILPAGNPADRMRTATTDLDDVRARTARATDTMLAGWRGAGSDGAVTATETTRRTGRLADDDAAEIGRLVVTASARVRSAAEQLDGLVDSFERYARTLGDALFTPAGLAAIVPVAADHVQRGLAVVARARADLADDTHAMTELARHQAPAEASGPSTPTPAAGTDLAGGPGVAITLPDGSVVHAPNERAATAVRAALSQRGVPYVWGGTSPAGFDCSGLTQWAYRQAGLDIPRLAQDQDTAGTAVSQADLQPGDLAVWSGHVAMYIGNGQMVEAGDPVQVSPVRTTNLDQTFEGFYRPR